MVPPRLVPAILWVVLSAAQLSQRAQMVTASADVSVLRSRGCSLAVLACDGLWDVMGSEEVVAFVSARLARGIAFAATSAELVTTAMLLGSKDNISVMLVELRPIATTLLPPSLPLSPSVLPTSLEAAVDLLFTESIAVSIELRELRQRLADVGDRLARLGCDGAAGSTHGSS